MKENTAFEKIVRCVNKTLIVYLNRYLDKVLIVNILIEQYLSTICVLCREWTTKVTSWS